MWTPLVPKLPDGVVVTVLWTRVWVRPSTPYFLCLFSMFKRNYAFYGTGDGCALWVCMQGAPFYMGRLLCRRAQLRKSLESSPSRFARDSEGRGFTAAKEDCQWNGAYKCDRDAPRRHTRESSWPSSPIFKLQVSIDRDVARHILVCLPYLSGHCWSIISDNKNLSLFFCSAASQVLMNALALFSPPHYGFILMTLTYWLKFAFYSYWILGGQENNYFNTMAFCSFSRGIYEIIFLYATVISLSLG